MKASKIRTRIATLETQLREVEEAERERKVKRFTSVAEKTGLLDLQLDPGVLRREFDALTKRLAAGAESADTAAGDDGAQTPTTTAGLEDAPASGTETAPERKRWGV